MTPPPPRFTLFPYTTLFRSERQQDSETATGAADVRRQAGPEGGAGAGRTAPARHKQRAHRHRDRKSTRLNSSHLGISYAVFCLKKKRTSHHGPTEASTPTHV